MPKISDKKKTYVVELSQEEVNHIVVAIGKTSLDAMRERAEEVHHMNILDDHDTHYDFYEFFLGLSESAMK